MAKVEVEVWWWETAYKSWRHGTGQMVVGGTRIRNELCLSSDFLSKMKTSESGPEIEPCGTPLVYFWQRTATGAVTRLDRFKLSYHYHYQTNMCLLTLSWVSPAYRSHFVVAGSGPRGLDIFPCGPGAGSRSSFPGFPCKEDDVREFDELQWNGSLLRHHKTY